jgi:hypothetical protein
MATLKAGNHCSLLSEQINDLALALVTPLCAQNNNAFSHFPRSLYLNYFFE